MMMIKRSILFELYDLRLSSSLFIYQCLCLIIIIESQQSILISILFMGNYPNQQPNSNLRDGAVVIITGASSGLGRQLTLQLSHRPFRIIITGRNSQRLQETKQICQKQGKAQIQKFIGDLSVEQKCKQLIDEVIQKYNRIDLLILNAGINAHFHFTQLQKLSVFEQLMKTNLYANIYLTKYALPFIRKNQSQIVVISSLSGKFGLPERSAYCASKFALTGFFQSLRTQEQKISITMVYPTSIDTPMRTNDILGYTNASKQSKNKRQSASECAQIIVKQLKKGQKDIYIPMKGFMGVVLQPLFPNFIRQKLIKASKL